MVEIVQDFEPFFGYSGRNIPDTGAFQYLRKLGVVDIGSNSVRMVIFDGAARSPAYFFNEKVFCGLGSGLANSGKLHIEGRLRAISAIERFVNMAKVMGVPQLTLIATGAVRSSSDGSLFCDEIKRKTGKEIKIIDGRDEARLSAQGVMLGWPGAYGLVCDLGGSSMELAEISKGNVGKCSTSELGPLILKELKGGRKKRKQHIKVIMTKLAAEMGPQHNRLFLVGGSWRAFAKIDMLRRGYPLHVMHEYRISLSSVKKTIKFIEASELENIRKKCGITAARIELVPIACEILSRLVSTFKPKDIAISSYGIREGLLYENMPQELRDRDPLIEACHFSEAKDARVPGSGNHLYKFVLPLFSRPSKELKRLIHAACLLHDVSWRANPDYRAEICFDNATRSNLGGLKHSERIFLGIALMYRYRNKPIGSQFENLVYLLEPKFVQKAEVLGKAMRLGAMLWVNDSRQPAHLNWKPRSRHLTLKLNSKGVSLFGEVAEARYNSLANSLQAKDFTIKVDKKTEIN